MATLNRRPLADRSLQRPSVLSPSKPFRAVSASKRPRSPDPAADPTASHPVSKRVKAAAPSPASVIRDKNKERKQAEREQQKAEFKEKYTRAFPGFTFYFEEGAVGHVAQESYEEMIEQLGSRTVRFLESKVTHFISNRPPTQVHSSVGKENKPKSVSGTSLKSPIKLRGPSGEGTECGPGIDALTTATNLELKVWNTTKLESVLTRLLEPSVPPSRSPPVKKQAPSLARLLKSEQIHGTTERDPTQKRHDFKYFSRGSKFVLVEDMREELATIAAHEYRIPKARDGLPAKVPWPVLHCHPNARGPFIPYDEKEKRRWEKSQKTEVVQKDEQKAYRDKIRQAEVMKRKAEANLYAKRSGDLRRSVSMNNLHRRASVSAAGDDECLVDLDGEGDIPDSANASGFLASGTAGYMAASGNSVGITSTAGTTSTAGYTSRNIQLPSALSGRMKQHVTTSRKFPSAAVDKENKPAVMGPPAVIPERQPLLRKSRSTNTLKLPKREEGSKPGYCESCRVKFDDFKTHIAGRKHQRFATSDANFAQLDCVLARVQRRTQAEVLEQKRKREEAHRYYCARVQEDEGLYSNTFDSPTFGDRTFQMDTFDEDIEMQGDSDGPSDCQ
ncbi:Hsk1-interacting molecule 1 [Hypsizygus marmoreus]|uniref:Hsk1-interacting molecule 1 n=1 Tax=Hypsizygus marmoreus TaxID=39966 RepID=A0A369JVL7_HYPMA|nr:Hsk1-interacting molecule 1 [Hypsizygus marmoreus]